MQFVERVRGAIKAQWAFSLVLVITAFTTWLLIANGHHGLEQTAYEFAVVIIGALGTKSVLGGVGACVPYDDVDDRSGDVPCCRGIDVYGRRGVQGFGGQANAC